MAAHANLPAQGFPVQHKGRNARRLDFGALGAFEIGIEHKAAIGACALDFLQKHHAHIGQARGIDRGQRDGIGVVGFGPFGLGQPASCDIKGIVTRENSASITHGQAVTNT